MKIKLAWPLLALVCFAVAIALFVRARDAAPLPSYRVTGIVLSVETDDRLLLIDHEDIPGFMPAMAMFFRVDAATHRAARPDDRIAATLVRHEESLVLHDVKLTPVPAAKPKQP
jgi:protein SCO1/2